MRTVFENLHACLSVFYGNNKSEDGENLKGCYGIPLLSRLKTSRGKSSEQALPQTSSLKGIPFSLMGSSCRVHSIGVASPPLDSDSQQPPDMESAASDVPSICFPIASAEASHIFQAQPCDLPIQDSRERCLVGSLKSPGKSRGGLRDCHGRSQSIQDHGGRCKTDAALGQSVRNSMDDPFDKCTTEYYSCRRKGIHNCRLAPPLPGCEEADVAACALEADYEDEIHEKYCIESDSRQCSDLSDTEDLIVGSSSRCILPNARPPLEVKSNKPHEAATSQARRNSGEISSSSDLYFNSRDSEQEKDPGNIYARSAFATSPTRDYRRSFPPPLTSFSMQSYADRKRHSPGTCGAGYCLRSVRKDGRFVLQEVRAPMHRFFIVSRKDGRLKLALINPGGESSAENEGGNYDDDDAGGESVEKASENVGKTEESKDEQLAYLHCSKKEEIVVGSAPVAISPGCPEIRGMCNNQTPSMKSSSWVHPISAF